MNHTDKIVTTIPLYKIWTADKELMAKRTSSLTNEDIHEILKKHPVKFVVANCGDKLKWVDIDKCYDFWKSEAEKHIAEYTNRIDLESFPGQYAYIALEWAGGMESPVILLEKIH